MRLAFLTQTYPRFPSDTAGSFIHSMARGLVELGHEVRVLAPHWKGRDGGAPHFDPGVPLTVFRYAPADSAHQLGYSQTMQGDVALRKSAYLWIPTYVAAGARTLGRLIDEHHLSLVNAHWVIPNGFVAALATRRRRVPLVVSLHGTDVFVAARNWIFSMAAKKAFRAAAAVTACSPDFLAVAIRLGAAPECCHLLPYGVDSEIFSPGEPSPGFRQSLGLPAGARVVLGLGRLVYKKGFGCLIEAMGHVRRAVPEAHLVLAGAGDLGEELRQAARRAGIEAATRFPGVVYRDRLLDFYRLAEVVAVPSIHDAAGNVDGLPNVLLEAMACGKPVAASRVSGIPLAITDNVEGRLVPENDAGALAGTILEMLQDSAYAARLGTAARERMLREFTWRQIAAKLAAVYETTR